MSQYRHTILSEGVEDDSSASKACPATPSFAMSFFSKSERDTRWVYRWPSLSYSPWNVRSNWTGQRPGILKVLSRVWIAPIIVCGIYFLAVFHRHAAPSHGGFILEPPQYYEPSPHLPLIPPKIWQVYLDFKGRNMEPYKDNIHSWIAHSPSYGYSIMDDAGALGILSTLAQSPRNSHIPDLYKSLPRRVMKIDFLRYLVLAISGGVYSDIDTHLVKPIGHWVPNEYKSATRLIIGIEADSSPPVGGTMFETQFAQWTLAAAPDHPAMWAMVDSIRKAVESRLAADGGNEFTDEAVLDITGPAGWTRVIYKCLSEAAGSPIDWRNITGLRSPRLYGDILVLPIDAFATGLAHSGSSLRDSPQTLVRHLFGHSWRGGIN